MCMNEPCEGKGYLDSHAAGSCFTFTLVYLALKCEATWGKIRAAYAVDVMHACLVSMDNSPCFDTLLVAHISRQ